MTKYFSDKIMGKYASKYATNKYDNLRSQIETSNWGGTRTLPYAFYCSDRIQGDY